MSEDRVRKEWQRLHKEIYDSRSKLQVAELEKKQLERCRDGILTGGRVVLERWDDPRDKLLTKTAVTLEELMDLWEQGWR